MDLKIILLMNTVDHVAWILSVLLFLRIIVAVLASLRKVSSTSDSSESAITSAFKQMRVVKTPMLMIIFFTIISAANLYLWDVYAIQNWEYFGPSEAPIAKSVNDATLFSLWQ